VTESDAATVRAAATDCARVADDYSAQGLNAIAERMRAHAAALWEIARQEGPARRSSVAEAMERGCIRGPRTTASEGTVAMATKRALELGRRKYEARQRLTDALKPLGDGLLPAWRAVLALERAAINVGRYRARGTREPRRP